MAVVKAINNKNQTGDGMAFSIAYAAKDKKTILADGTKLVTGIRCTPDTAYQEFMTTKHLYDKADGRYFYHYMQSFSPEEKVSPETVHEIGVKLANECFPGHEIVVGTHVEKHHLHNHIVVNSVGIDTGKKLHQDNHSLDHIKNISDRLCLEYGLSIIENKSQKTAKGMSHGEYTAASKGYSWKFQLINTIEDAMNVCKKKKEFIAYMESEGYKVNWTDARKTICYTAPNGMKCRDYKLHEDKFLKENMENEFKFREIEGNESAYSVDRFSTDSELSGRFEYENRQTFGAESGQADGENGITFRTGWEDTRSNLQDNRRETQEDLYQDTADSRSGNDCNDFDFSIAQRVLKFVKDVSDAGKKKDYDEDDTMALSLITGLSAAAVCILIEIIKSAKDDELTEEFIDEVLGSIEETEQDEDIGFGDMSL